MAYPDPKGERDSSLPGKRRSGPGVRAEVSRDPRDMAKAGLPEAESPEDEKTHPPARHPVPAPCSATACFQGRRNLRGVERCPVRAIKEMSRTPKSRSDVQQGRTRDQPTGRECQWPSVSPQVRPSVLPTGGHLFSPLVAMSSPHDRVGERPSSRGPSREGEAPRRWSLKVRLRSGASPPCRRSPGRVGSCRCRR